MIPRQHFIPASLTVCVESRIQAAFPECFHPQVIPESFIPSIQDASFFKSPLQYIAHAPVAPGKASFKEADKRFVPVERDTFDIQDLFQVFLFGNDLFQGVLGSPLERSE